MKQILHKITLFLIALTLSLGAFASTPTGGEDALIDNNKVFVSAAYPNPAEGGVAFIDFNITQKTIGPVKILVFNVLGSKVEEYTLPANQKQIQLNTAGYQSGLYFYTLNINGDNYTTKRLLVKN